MCFFPSCETASSLLLLLLLLLPPLPRRRRRRRRHHRHVVISSIASACIVHRLFTLHTIPVWIIGWIEKQQTATPQPPPNMKSINQLVYSIVSIFAIVSACAALPINVASIGESLIKSNNCIVVTFTHTHTHPVHFWVDIFLQCIFIYTMQTAQPTCAWECDAVFGACMHMAFEPLIFRTIRLSISFLQCTSNRHATSKWYLTRQSIWRQTLMTQEKKEKKENSQNSEAFSAIFNQGSIFLLHIFRSWQFFSNSNISRFKVNMHRFKMKLKWKSVATRTHIAEICLNQPGLLSLSFH